MLRIGETVDRYTIEALIGQGGMAAVYRARHSTLDSLHAVKVLFITAPEIRTRLMREGKVQANLRHPNIVAVTDVLDVHGSPALVMEYVDGPPLDQWLSTHEPTLPQALFLFRGVLKGVISAHERGVIHRDLKPANVLLATTSEGVLPKVADFGLTKSVKASSGQTQTGMAMGTPEYMAPEQIRDASDVDERVDMFALGCLLYELVCHRRAFDGPDNVAIFNAIVSGDYTDPVLLMPDLPRNVLMALKWLLEPDRKKRLASATELFDLLYDAGEAISLDVGATPVEPIAISTLVHEPTPLPARQMSVPTQPTPEPRVVTPRSSSRHTIPLIPADTTQPIELPDEPARVNLVRLALPVFLLLVVAGTLGVIAMTEPIDVGERPPEPVAPTPGVAPAPPSPEPAVAEPEGPAGLPAPQPAVQPGPGPVAPTARPTPRPEPAPATPQPEPATAQPEPTTPAPEPKTAGSEAAAPQPEPAPATTNPSVSVSGDARGVWLVGGGAKYALPGTIPPGDYAIEADFGEGPVSAGQVNVREGQALKLNCTGFLFQCRPQ